MNSQYFNHLRYKENVCVYSVCVFVCVNAFVEIEREERGVSAVAEL